ncbi:hypothetical protein SDC9_21679 [bioreactor metagenome]|uniref:DedA family protein n=1 Tax=bioreactor metagenome TaxID=1076179 RepID=A0A644UAF3_9ZZZZ|nr:hypothetical protein [Candidatus Elulimicrobiales bacterium]
MIETIIEAVASFLSSYKYFFLIVTSLLQGRMVAVFAGLLINMKELAFWPTYLILVFIGVISDAAYYFLGRFGSNSKIAKKHEEKIGYIKKFWDKHPGKVIIFGKVTMVFIVPVLILSGLVKFPLKKLFKYTIITDLVFVLVLLGTGYFFGNAFGENYRYLGAIASLFVIGFIFVIFVLKYLGKKKISAQTNSTEKQ